MKVINPVSGAGVDAQLEYPLAAKAVVAKIAVLQSHETADNGNFPFSVSKAFKPIDIRDRLLLVGQGIELNLEHDIFV
jgi:hypothetical protein